MHCSYIINMPGFAMMRRHDQSGAPIAGACGIGGGLLRG
jgi:hypothetical protein